MAQYWRLDMHPFRGWSPQDFRAPAGAAHKRISRSVSSYFRGLHNEAPGLSRGSNREPAHGASNRLSQYTPIASTTVPTGD